MVSLINNSRARLAWFVQDVWGHFDDDHLPDWRGQVTPHLLRHFCTSQQL